jgi:hypothetical protein
MSEAVLNQPGSVSVDRAPIVKNVRQPVPVLHHHGLIQVQPLPLVVDRLLGHRRIAPRVLLLDRVTGEERQDEDDRRRGEDVQRLPAGVPLLR